MKSTVSLFAATVVAAIRCLTQVQAHGYMLIPLTEFKGAATGAWIVQIAPQFQANWESVVNDDELIALYVEKCGFSNPDAKPKDPPSDGTATIERGLAHHGPCEIWLDDTLALHNDDCAKAFSVKDYMSIKEARVSNTFGRYKNCIPLSEVKPVLPVPGSPRRPSRWTQARRPRCRRRHRQHKPPLRIHYRQNPPLQTVCKRMSQRQELRPLRQKPKRCRRNGPHHPRRGMKAHPLLKPRKQTRTPPPTVTNAPVWTNVPAVESSGTVTPFTQTEMAQSPVLDTAANTPNSFSFNNGNQATNAAASGQEQMSSTMVVPAFSF
ncbi:hypothetical protein PC121_g5621 [Phytophthora cactorum]|nr:hypothetical protein PC121_g5621 [Phytophthora cactorum]